MFKYLLIILSLFSIVFAQKSTLPIPRFVSLKAAAVNFHVGPGTDYPTDWQYVRKSLPVEVIAEFGHWRLLRDVKGNQGWVHRNLLSGKRTALITGDKICLLYDEPNTETAIVAKLEKNVICQLKECRKDWCYVEINRIKGWIKRKNTWGTYAHELEF